MQMSGISSNILFTPCYQKKYSDFCGRKLLEYKECKYSVFYCLKSGHTLWHQQCFDWVSSSILHYNSHALNMIPCHSTRFSFKEILLRLRPVSSNSIPYNRGPQLQTIATIYLTLLSWSGVTMLVEQSDCSRLTIISDALSVDSSIAMSTAYKWQVHNRCNNH